MGCGACRAVVNPGAYELEQSLLSAVSDGDVEKTRSYLNAGAKATQWQEIGDDATQSPRRRVLALHLAARHPNFDAPEAISLFAILEARSPTAIGISGRAQIDTYDGDSRTALWEATRRCNVLVARELLRLGADPSILCSKERTAPIHLAAIEDAFVLTRGKQNKEGEFSVFHYMMTPTALTARCGFGSTPLHYAAYYGNLVAVRVLLEAGLVEHDVLDDKGNTPLDQAARPVLTFSNSSRTEEEIEKQRAQKEKCAQLLRDWSGAVHVARKRVSLKSSGLNDSQRDATRNRRKSSKISQGPRGSRGSQGPRGSMGNPAPPPPFSAAAREDSTSPVADKKRGSRPGGLVSVSSAQ